VGTAIDIHLSQFGGLPGVLRARRRAASFRPQLLHQPVPDQPDSVSAGTPTTATATVTAAGKTTAAEIPAPSSFQNLDPNELCSDLLPTTQSSARIGILQNGIPYTVGVASVDTSGNASPSRAASSSGRCQPSILSRVTGTKAASRPAAIARWRAGVRGSEPFHFWLALDCWV